MANPESIDKAIRGAINDGIGKCLLGALDNRFRGCFRSSPRRPDRAARTCPVSRHSRSMTPIRTLLGGASTWYAVTSRGSLQRSGDTVQTHPTSRCSGARLKGGPGLRLVDRRTGRQAAPAARSGRNLGCHGQALGRTADACRRRHSDRARSEPKSKRPPNKGRPLSAFIRIARPAVPRCTVGGACFVLAVEGHEQGDARSDDQGRHDAVDDDHGDHGFVPGWTSGISTPKSRYTSATTSARVSK